MNREPKFRAFDKTVTVTGMIDVTELKYDEHGLSLIIGYARNDKEPVIIRVTSHTHLLEFIGAKDESGKDVVEGDIVLWNYGDGPPAFMAKVVRADTIFKGDLDRDRRVIGFVLEFNDGGMTDFPENFVVVGNVHEHPELLEESHDPE